MKGLLTKHARKPRHVEHVVGRGLSPQAMARGRLGGVCPSLTTDRRNRLLEKWVEKAGWRTHPAFADGTIFVAQSAEDVQQMHHHMLYCVLAPQVSATLSGAMQSGVRLGPARHRIGEV